MTIDTVEIQLLQHQYDFLVSDAPWLLSDGGRGSGKTNALARKVVERASHPGAREGLFRQKLIDLRSTTLKTLFDGDGYNPPVLYPGTYDHNQALKTIKIRGGGEIVYNGMDQGDARRQMGSTGRGSSLNLSGAAFDEWVEMTEANVLQISASVRVKVDGLPLQRYGVCNPGPPSHWIAKRFGLAPGESIKPRHERIMAPAWSNHFLPAETLEELRSYEGVAYERYYLGKWVGSDGLVYDRWDRQVHVRETDGEPKSVLIGVDEGYTDPFVALEIHLDSDGRAHIAREIYQSKMTQDEKIEAVKSISGDATVVVDSAAPDLIESMRRAGIRATPANKGQGSINHGIGLVQTRLADAGDGRPRLTVDPSCVNTIREFETYEWSGNRDGGLDDKPIDKNNHAMDALRYAIASLQKRDRLHADTPIDRRARRLREFIHA